MQCQAITKSGTQCKHATRDGSAYCYLHAKEETLVTTTLPPPSPVFENSTSQPSAASAAQPTRAERPVDPFQAIAAAMEAAAQQAERGAAPQSAPRHEAAGPQRPNSGYAKAVYTAAYGLGFGVAFPAFLVLGMLPADGAVARGLVDGAQAARDALEGKSRRE